MQNKRHQTRDRSWVCTTRFFVVFWSTCPPGLILQTCRLYLHRPPSTERVKPCLSPVRSHAVVAMRCCVPGSLYSWLETARDPSGFLETSTFRQIVLNDDGPLDLFTAAPMSLSTPPTSLSRSVPSIRPSVRLEPGLGVRRGAGDAFPTLRRRRRRRRPGRPEEHARQQRRC